MYTIIYQWYMYYYIHMQLYVVVVSQSEVNISIYYVVHLTYTIMLTHRQVSYLCGKTVRIIST